MMQNAFFARREIQSKQPENEVIKKRPVAGFGRGLFFYIFTGINLYDKI
jgi:hypothetical protein